MTKDQRAQSWMNRVCDEIPAATTAAGIGRATCILHTKLALIRARQDGIRARPLTCQVQVANRALLELSAQLGHPADTEEWTPECWSLGIGYGFAPGGRGYDGHVVAIVRERFVLDLTIDQASRPHRDIDLRPGFFGPLPDGFLSGATPVGFEMNGSSVRYEALPADRGFLQTPDWTMVRAGDSLVREILRQAA